MVYKLASLKYARPSTRIHAGHVPTRNSQLRDEPQHIAQVLHGGDLPVIAVATAAHDPGDEGGSRNRRAVFNMGECRAAVKRSRSDPSQRMREGEGRECTAPVKSTKANRGQSIR